MDHFSVKFARAHDREFTLAVCFSDSSMASSVVKVGTWLSLKPAVAKIIHQNLHWSSEFTPDQWFLSYLFAVRSEKYKDELVPLSYGLKLVSSGLHHLPCMWVCSSSVRTAEFLYYLAFLPYFWGGSKLNNSLKRQLKSLKLEVISTPDAKCSPGGRFPLFSKDVQSLYWADVHREAFTMLDCLQKYFWTCISKALFLCSVVCNGSRPSFSKGCKLASGITWSSRKDLSTGLKWLQWSKAGTGQMASFCHIWSQHVVLLLAWGAGGC